MSHVSDLNRYDRTTTDFKRWLNGNEAYLPLTYDSETALKQRDLPFITPVHPLAKVAINYWKDVSKPLVARLSLKDSKIRAGAYFFVLELWESVGVRSGIRLRTFAWDIHRQMISTDMTSLLSLIERASDLEDFRARDIDIQHCIDSVNEYTNKIRLNEVEQLRGRNDKLLRRQLASQQSYYQNRLIRVKVELEQSTNERIRIMRRAEKSRIESEFDRKQREIEERRICDIIVNRIALGIVRIKQD